jgi:hypothetical protein
MYSIRENNADIVNGYLPEGDFGYLHVSERLAFGYSRVPA